MKSYQDYKVGERVYCLAWTGKQFEIAAKDDSRQLICLHAQRENVPWGARIDILPSRMWMLTDEPWDEVWYWPDRSGEHYTDVFQRFSRSHKPGEVLTGYRIGDAMSSETPTPERAMAHRIHLLNECSAIVEPVVGFADGSLEPIKEARTDASIQWVSAGPVGTAKIRMLRYRWAVTSGESVLNWQDFTPCDWMSVEHGN